MINRLMEMFYLVHTCIDICVFHEINRVYKIKDKTRLFKYIGKRSRYDKGRNWPKK